MNELNASQELERRKRLAVDQWFTLFDDLISDGVPQHVSRKVAT